MPRFPFFAWSFLCSIFLPQPRFLHVFVKTTTTTTAAAFTAAHLRHGALSPRVAISTNPLRHDRCRSSLWANQNHDDACSADRSLSPPPPPSRRRRRLLAWPTFTLLVGSMMGSPSHSAVIEEEEEEVLVGLTGEAKKLFNEGRALEMQGNIGAANRIYAKTTSLVPRFIYGWSNLGNTQVALGDLSQAERSYSTSIDLCVKQRDMVPDTAFGVRRCDDLYLLLLNRGCVRLNNNMAKEALADLEQAASLRAKPDPVVLQNRARARELNGLYGPADRDYDLAISMTSNEVSPFWLRAAMVKFQLGDFVGALDLSRRVENKFPEAPEVRAALATMLWHKGGGEEEEKARKKFLEIPDRAREKFGSGDYVMDTVAWPPAMREYLTVLRKAVGDEA